MPDPIGYCADCGASIWDGDEAVFFEGDDVFVCKDCMTKPDTEE